MANDLQKYFGITQPRLAFTGLNPHAGENGTMGREEQTIIIPAINQLRAEGLTLRDRFRLIRRFMRKRAQLMMPFSACITTRP